MFAYLGFTVAVRADHSEIIATGRPEQVLAGIHVYRSRVPETVKRLGKPSSIHDEPVADAPDAVSRDYIWHSDNCVLTAGTYNVHGNNGILYFVSVTGCTRTPKGWRTGRGLQLGMTLGEVKPSTGHASPARLFRGAASITSFGMGRH
jgi:hypothetical protein